MKDEVHISSMIVHAAPPSVDALVETISNTPNLEVATADQQHGKIIVVAEEDSMRAISDHMDNFKTLDGVLSVSMVYHHVESNQSLREEIA